VLYHIRIDGSPQGVDLRDARLHDFADIVETPTDAGTVLSCRVPDKAALTGLVALLHDLGLGITELHVVPDVEDEAR